jgi:hypothetical protein
LSIMDINGREMFTQPVPMNPRMEIDISALSQGIYLLRIIPPDNRSRLVISRIIIAR